MTGLNSTAARSGVTGILSQILSLTEGLSATPLSHGFWTCDTALFKIFSEPSAALCSLGAATDEELAARLASGVLK